MVIIQSVLSVCLCTAYGYTTVGSHVQCQSSSECANVHDKESDMSEVGLLQLQTTKGEETDDDANQRSLELFYENNFFGAVDPVRKQIIELQEKLATSQANDFDDFEVMAKNFDTLAAQLNKVGAELDDAKRLTEKLQPRATALAAQVKSQAIALRERLADDDDNDDAETEDDDHDDEKTDADDGYDAAFILATNIGAEGGADDKFAVKTLAASLEDLRKVRAENQQVEFVTVKALRQAQAALKKANEVASSSNKVGKTVATRTFNPEELAKYEQLVARMTDTLNNFEVKLDFMPLRFDEISNRQFSGAVELLNGVDIMTSPAGQLQQQTRVLETRLEKQPVPDYGKFSLMKKRFAIGAYQVKKSVDELTKIDDGKHVLRVRADSAMRESLTMLENLASMFFLGDGKRPISIRPFYSNKAGETKIDRINFDEQNTATIEAIRASGTQNDWTGIDDENRKLDIDRALRFGDKTRAVGPVDWTGIDDEDRKLDIDRALRFNDKTSRAVGPAELQQLQARSTVFEAALAELDWSLETLLRKLYENQVVARSQRIPKIKGVLAPRNGVDASDTLLKGKIDPLAIADDDFFVLAQRLRENVGALRKRLPVRKIEGFNMFVQIKDGFESATDEVHNSIDEMNELAGEMELQKFRATTAMDAAVTRLRKANYAIELTNRARQSFWNRKFSSREVDQLQSMRASMKATLEELRPKFNDLPRRYYELKPTQRTRNHGKWKNGGNRRRRYRR